MSTQHGGFRLHRVVPFGCKVSRAEAAAIALDLERRGGTRAGEDEAADLVVVHACTVTARAERDALKEIRRQRRENPGAEIVVSGCLARHSGERLARMDEVDAVDREGGTGFAPDSPDIEEGRTRAFLKVQDGCERRCAYCPLPFLRGRERSVPAGEVLAAIRRLDALGVPEVVLAGIHLAAYRAGAGGLGALLDLLEASPPACRIRLSSLEPMEAGKELVDHVAASAVVVPHLHLPLQSGSDAVLRRLRRGMTRARFESLVRRAAARNPRLHLATDLIAGFPGESDAEFLDGLDFVASLPVASIHVFPFSPRPGTEAELLHRDGPDDPARRAERAAALRLLAAEKLAAFTLQAAGSTADVVALRGGTGLPDHYLQVDLLPAETAPAPGSRFRALLEARAGSSRLLARPLSLPSRAGPAPC